MNSSRKEKETHTFINSIIHLLEEMDKWAADPSISKDDFLKDMRTKILLLLKDGMVYPYMTFYGLEESTVFTQESQQESQQNPTTKQANAHASEQVKEQSEDQDPRSQDPMEDED